MTWLTARDRAAAQPLPASGNVLLDVHWLGRDEHRDYDLPEPYGPDVIVFGPRYEPATEQ
jgi:hypothetical protein